MNLSSEQNTHNNWNYRLKTLDPMKSSIWQVLLWWDLKCLQTTEMAKTAETVELHVYIMIIFFLKTPIIACMWMISFLLQINHFQIVQIFCSTSYTCLNIFRPLKCSQKYQTIRKLTPVQKCIYPVRISESAPLFLENV